MTNLLLAFNIDIEIEKIRNADKEQRYILMNNLKRKLAQQNLIRRKEMLERIRVHSHQSSQNKNPYQHCSQQKQPPKYKNPHMRKRR